MTALRRMPPAIFPAVLGLLGLGIAWRAGGRVLAMPEGLSETYLGGVMLLAAAMVLAYAAKLALRPAVLAEDLRPLPGKAGLGALGLCIMMMAEVIFPYSPGAAGGLMLSGLVVQAGIAGLLLVLLVRGPAEQRVPHPVLHLPFVGAIVSVPTLVALELDGLALLIFWLSLAGAVAIGVGSLLMLRRGPIPPPLRPAQAIHLAPASLLSLAALMLGMGDLAMICAGIAMGLAAILLARMRWLTEAGFSPFWAAFTFPVAALAKAFLILRAVGAPPIFGTLGSLALVAATVLCLGIGVMILRMLFTGDLAARTNAARA